MINLIEPIRQWRQPRWLPVLYNGFLAGGALFTLFSILGSQSESRKAFLLGYSLERVLLGSGLLILFLFFTALTVKLVRQPEWSRHVWGGVFERNKVPAVLAGIAGVVFLTCWIILFWPSYRFAGNLAGYVSQLRAVIVWLAVVGAATMLLILFERGKESFKGIILMNRTAVWAGILIFGLSIFMGALVIFTGLGILHAGDYWYGTGVPVLGLQILFALTVGIFVMWIDGRAASGETKITEWLICFAIFFVTAWLWAREPLRPNFFMPDTVKNVLYPYSDSATFDIGSQFALIGQGLFNNQFFDRALYSALLTYLHILFGQDFEQLLTAQAVVYAVFPVIVYLLVKELHSRALGLSAAILITLRGVNSLVSATWIDLASPKMILTDFPTAIGIGLVILFVLKWIKEPARIDLAAWAGGMIGLTLMLRIHVLLLVPFIILYVFLFGARLRWSYRVIGSLVMIFGMLAATMPWDIRNRSTGLPMFYMYYARIQLILEARYGIHEDTHLPPAPSMSSDIRNSRGRIALQKLPETQGLHRFEMGECSNLVCSFANHFFHNLITSVLFLPTSPIFHDLWNIIKEGAPFWRADWRGGGVGFSEGIFISINLALISLGVGAAWERNRFIGILPVAVFLVYIMSNALVLTSGGRYITPVDWILCVYYMAGLLQLAAWVMRKAGAGFMFQNLALEKKAESSFRYSGIISAFVLIFAVGALVPLSEMSFERRYQASSADETLAMLEQKGLLEQAGFSRDDLSTFLTDPQADMLVGRLLYPRFYRAGQGEMDRHYPYVVLEYSRLVFLTIGPFPAGQQSVIIAGDKPNYELQAADVVVVGCKNELHLDGLVFFVLNEPGHIYQRWPQSELKCPLEIP